MNSTDHKASEPGCKCDDCGALSPLGSLNPIKLLHERVDFPEDHPDYVAPAGECPVCGALAYIIA